MVIVATSGGVFIPNGPVTPAIYSTVAITPTISCIVIAIVGPIASVNVPA